VWRQLGVAPLAERAAAGAGAADGDLVADLDADRDLPVIRDPGQLLVFVAGGTIPIPQHVWFPGWGFPPAQIVRAVPPPAG
jgi:hypothetical protein